MSIGPVSTDEPTEAGGRNSHCSHIAAVSLAAATMAAATSAGLASGASLTKALPASLAGVTGEAEPVTPESLYAFGGPYTPAQVFKAISGEGSEASRLREGYMRLIDCQGNSIPDCLRYPRPARVVPPPRRILLSPYSRAILLCHRSLGIAISGGRSLCAFCRATGSCSPVWKCKAMRVMSIGSCTVGETAPRFP